MGGSLGMAAGEAIVRGLELAVEKKSPFIVFAASGGARMQEGILSLMQMPRTTVGVQMLREAKLPYIVVLTNPTTGGVTASYAMLGDVQIAEPGALIGFAGARVIEQTIREKLPEGFQRAEYLRDHGMVDMVVHRHEMRPTLARLCRLLTKSPALEAASKPAPQVTDPAADRIGAGIGAGRAARVNAACRQPPPARRIDRAAVGAASETHRSRPRSHAPRCWSGSVIPKRKLPPVIHVAGTNGKGSTIAYLRAMLEAAGLRVHVYTSPYLVRINECFRLGASGGGGWSVTTSCARLLEHCERVNAGEPITIFEIETAAAFCLFAQHPADVVLLEVGLGGRLDATNVIDSAARDRHHAGQHGPHGISRRHADRDRRREGRDHQARRAGGLRRAGAGGDGRDRGAGQAHARAAACGGPAMACQCRARAAGLSGRARPDGSGGAKTVRPASVRQCRACDRDACARSMRSRSACRRSRPASSTPNGRRGCSGWSRARWSIWPRRAARSGSTADTMPKAAASPPRRSAISRSGCRVRWW